MRTVTTVSLEQLPRPMTNAAIPDLPTLVARGARLARGKGPRNVVLALGVGGVWVVADPEYWFIGAPFLLLALVTLMLLIPLSGARVDALTRFATTTPAKIVWIELQPKPAGLWPVWLRSDDKQAWMLTLSKTDAYALAAQWRDLVPGLYLGPCTRERLQEWLKNPASPRAW